MRGCTRRRFRLEGPRSIRGWPSYHDILSKRLLPPVPYGCRSVTIPIAETPRPLRDRLSTQEQSLAELQALLESNAHYFNPHKLAPILLQVLERPADENRRDERLKAYLLRAQNSMRVYENFKELTSKDIAAAIVAAREMGHDAAEDLSDVIVKTVALEMPHLTAQRCSFFITAFAKQKIFDSTFWVAAGRAVAFSQEKVTPQVLVSFCDAFRKSGSRSKVLFTKLVHRVYGMADQLEPSFIPPILATVCRVPLDEGDRSRVVTLLLGKWLHALGQEAEHETGKINMSQLLSLTVSIGLAQEDVNTAVFARDVAAYVQKRWHLIDVDDIIVFLAAMQNLVVEGTFKPLFHRGLQEVLRSYSTLRSNSALSVQRLTQLSGVLVIARTYNIKDEDLRRLQSLVLEDLSESVLYCNAETLAEIIDIWAGNLAFWTRYNHFRNAVIKRSEELFLEAADLEGVLKLLQAFLGTPALYESLPDQVCKVLQKAVRSRGTSDLERIRAVLQGSVWEDLVQDEGDAAVSSTAPAATSQDEDKPSQSLRSDLQALIAKWAHGSGEMSLETFLKLGNEILSRAPAGEYGEEALDLLETAAPFAQRLADGATQEVFEQLTLLGDHLAARMETLSSAQGVATLTACAVAGLPHVPLAAAVTHFHETLSPKQLVEVVEACAALRLLIPDFDAWLLSHLKAGVDRRLPENSLARLAVAATRLPVLDGDVMSSLLERLMAIASPVSPPRPETVAMICQGIYLSTWPARATSSTNCVAQLWQVVQWLEQVHDAYRSPPEALAIRQFILGLLAREESRAIVAELRPQLQLQLAKSLRAAAEAAAPLAKRPPVSDTTLKFRLEATLAVPSTTSYDLELDLGLPLGLEGPIATVDIGLFDGSIADERGRMRPALNSMWLFDGPEAFLRPFNRGAMQLVPSELRRAELLAAMQQNGAALLSETLQRWEGTLHSRPLPELGIAFQPGQLHRLHWLEWAEMEPEMRRATLLHT